MRSSPTSAPGATSSAGASAAAALLAALAIVLIPQGAWPTGRSLSPQAALAQQADAPQTEAPQSEAPRTDIPADSGTRHALLIGVMGYPALRPDDRLTGPGNDVDLVAGFLRGAQGMENADIAILLDDGIHPPATLGAIRAEMARLAAVAGPGDFVYIHFSGHGTQMPAPPGSDEADGLDEVFLPYDTGFWNGGTGTIENALVDDEIGAMLDAIRARGADVFAVFDACNSGTVTRGADEVLYRRVAPETLGVPVPRAGPAAAGGAHPDPEAPFDAAPLPSGTAVPPGRLIAFFAAQSTQSTPELNLPPGDPDRRPHGLFTYTLLSELAAHPGQSYADLGTAILSRYATEGIAPGTQPMFEGALDLPALRVPAAAPAEVHAVWPVMMEGGIATLPAGSLHGLAPGDILEIRTDGAQDTLPRLHLREVTPLRATGALVGAPDPLPDDAVALAGPVRFSGQIAVALPQSADLPLAAALALSEGFFAADPDLAERLGFLPAGAVADLRLLVEGDRLVIAPGGGITGADSAMAAAPLASVPLGADMAAVARDLAPLLRLEARALLLTRAADALPPTLAGVSTVLVATPVAVSPARLLEPTEIPVLLPGEVVSITVANSRARPVDIDILYIAADRTIQHIRQIRAAPGESLTEPLFRVLPEGYGRELVLIVQREVESGAARDPLTFLATGAASAGLRTMADGDGPMTLSRYLAQAGLGASFRSPALADPGAAAITLVPVQTRPG